MKVKGGGYLLAVFINNPNVTYSVSEETDCSHCVEAS